MHDLTISNTTIRRDEAGRWCLNDLHQAAGGEKRHQPSDWLRLRQTELLIDEISVPGIPGTGSENGGSVPGIPGTEAEKGGFVPGIPGTGGVLPISVQQGGTWKGTFVCKELVYAYAMWVSPAFHLRVIRAYDAMQAPTHEVKRWLRTRIGDTKTISQRLAPDVIITTWGEIEHQLRTGAIPVDRASSILKAAGEGLMIDLHARYMLDPTREATELAPKPAKTSRRQRGPRQAAPPSSAGPQAGQQEQPA